MTHLTCIPQLQESLARDRVLATQARISEIRRLVYRASPEEVASYAAQHYAAPSVKAEPTVATDPSKKAVAGRTRVMLEAVLARDSLRAELRVVRVLLCCDLPATTDTGSLCYLDSWLRNISVASQRTQQCLATLPAGSKGSSSNGGEVWKGG